MDLLLQKIYNLSLGHYCFRLFLFTVVYDRRKWSNVSNRMIQVTAAIIEKLCNEIIENPLSHNYFIIRSRR